MGKSTIGTPYRVEDFGAIADGESDNTGAIQAAVDRCSKGGGGRVVLSSGTYVSGAIQLKSNVDLHIANGSTLMGTEDLEKYPETPSMFVDGCNETRNPERKGYALVYAYRARNIRLSGNGKIDMGGTRFQDKAKRPFLLRIIESSSVIITGLSLLQSAAWGCHLDMCSNVSLTNVTIRSQGVRNGDGLDIDSCTNITISGCNIKTGDDALCFKTTTQNPCRHIYVTDCILESDCAGVKFGTESVGDFSDIRITRCTIRNCGVVALKVTPVDGGSVENITFSDLKIEDCTGPIFVAVGNRGRRYMDQADPNRRSRVRHLVFQNIDITTRRYERSDQGVVVNDCGQGIVVSGCPGQIIENVRFKNLRTSFWGGIESYDRSGTEIPFITDQYPECHKLGILPAYGYFFQYAKNVSVEQCVEKLINPDIRPYRHELHLGKR